MKYSHRITTLCALGLALCLTLVGCGGGSKQASAASAEEATIHFLTNLQNGEFDQAKTYLDEGNPLLTVFPVAEGETAPELDALYQQFREKLSGLTFRVADEGAVGKSMVYIAATQYNFRAAINEAMLAAMEAQCREGGKAFADYSGWMSQGISNAAMGEESTVRAMATEKKGSYVIDHKGYTDHDFMNLFTGGFYDYADFQMAVCTNTMDGVDHTYYFAALGDQMIACIEEISESNENGELDDTAIAGLNEFYAQTAQQTPGMYSLLHDLGRTSEDRDDNHGDASVELAHSKGILLRGIRLTSKEYRMAELIIRFHCRDDQAGFDAIQVEPGFTRKDKERAWHLYQICKDMDGLDRVRFNGLDYRMLRTEFGRKLPLVAGCLLEEKLLEVLNPTEEEPG